MANAAAVTKAANIVNGLIALGSLSDDENARALLGALTVTMTATGIDVVARPPEAQLGIEARQAHDHVLEHIHDHLQGGAGK